MGAGELGIGRISDRNIQIRLPAVPLFLCSLNICISITFFFFKLSEMTHIFRRLAKRKEGGFTMLSKWFSTPLSFTSNRKHLAISFLELYDWRDL